MAPSPSSSPSRPPPPGWDQKDPIPWASVPESLSNHPPNSAVLSGRGPLFDFLPLWHAGGRAGWGPVCSKKLLWVAIALSSPFIAFSWKTRSGEAAPAAPRCSRGALTCMAPQKPSRSLPELNNAALVIASALANAPWLVHAAGGEHGPGPMDFMPELACSKVTPTQPRAHRAAPGKRGSDQGIGFYNT